MTPNPDDYAFFLVKILSYITYSKLLLEPGIEGKKTLLQLVVSKMIDFLKVSSNLSKDYSTLNIFSADGQVSPDEMKKLLVRLQSPMPKKENTLNEI